MGKNILQGKKKLALLRDPLNRNDESGVLRAENLDTSPENARRVLMTKDAAHREEEIQVDRRRLSVPEVRVRQGHTSGTLTVEQLTT